MTRLNMRLQKLETASGIGGQRSGPCAVVRWRLPKDDTDRKWASAISARVGHGSYAVFVTSAGAGDMPEVLVPAQSIGAMSDREFDLCCSIMEPGPHALLLTGENGAHLIFDISDGYAACLSRIKEELADAA